jgi:hypothetical protein
VLDGFVSRRRRATAIARDERPGDMPSRWGVMSSSGLRRASSRARKLAGRGLAIPVRTLRTAGMWTRTTSELPPSRCRSTVAAGAVRMYVDLRHPGGTRQPQDAGDRGGGHGEVAAGVGSAQHEVPRGRLDRSRQCGRKGDRVVEVGCPGPLCCVRTSREALTQKPLPALVACRDREERRRSSAAARGARELRRAAV